MKFATKSTRHYPPHLRHVATLPWEIAFKCTDFNSSTRVTVYAECIYVLTEYLQVPQLSQRDRAAVWVSCGPNTNIVFRIQRTLL